MEKKNVNKSEVFKLMNQLAKNGMNRKEAYAAAVAQLTAEPAVEEVVVTEVCEATPVVPDTKLAKTLIKLMKSCNVRFTFSNRHGRNITTTGTLMMEKVPTNRKVEGKKKAWKPDTIVFYDVRHGVYRQCTKASVVSIDKVYKK